MSVYKNMAFALKLRKLPRKQIDQRVRDAARVLDIEDLLDRKLSDLERKEEKLQRRDQDLEELEKKRQEQLKSIEVRRKDLEDMIDDERRKLTAISGLTPEMAKGILLERVEADIAGEIAESVGPLVAVVNSVGQFSAPDTVQQQDHDPGHELTTDGHG